MNTLVKADIFFFIASIATVVLTIILAILLIYGIKIAKRLKEITEMVKHESQNVVEDIAYVREQIKEQSDRFGSFLGSIVGLFTSGVFGGLRKKKEKSAKTKTSQARASGSRAGRATNSEKDENHSAGSDADNEDYE